MQDDDHVIEPEALPAGEHENGRDNSMMGELRRRHAELAEAKTLDLPVPGYNDTLVARYRVLDIKGELDHLQAKVAHEFRSIGEQGVYGTIDALIMACEGMYYNNGSELKPLSEGIGPDEPPVLYDDRLADFLGFEAQSARETVLETFGRNEPALIEHGRQLSVWMQNTSRTVMEGFLATLQ